MMQFWQSSMLTPGGQGEQAGGQIDFLSCPASKLIPQRPSTNAVTATRALSNDPPSSLRPPKGPHVAPLLPAAVLTGPAPTSPAAGSPRRPPLTMENPTRCTCLQCCTVNPCTWQCGPMEEWVLCQALQRLLSRDDAEVTRKKSVAHVAKIVGINRPGGAVPRDGLHDEDVGGRARKHEHHGSHGQHQATTGHNAPPRPVHLPSMTALRGPQMTMGLFAVPALYRIVILSRKKGPWPAEQRAEARCPLAPTYTAAAASSPACS